MATAKVTGVAEVQAALSDVQPDLNREVVQEVRPVATSLAGAIAGSIPSPPLSGFERSGWEGASVNAYEGKNRSDSEWYIYKVVLSEGMAAMADMAGAGGGGRTPQGQRMTAALNARYGGAARWTWRAAGGQEGSIEGSMGRAAEHVEDSMTRRLAE